jgi:sulfonate transport system substrate-binding protein
VEVDFKIIELAGPSAVKAFSPGKSMVITSFVRALADTIAWVRKNLDEQARLVAPKFQFTETAIITTFERGAKGLQTIGGAFYAKQPRNLGELLAAGVLKQLVSASDLYVGVFNGDIFPSISSSH